ncbi:MAG TPA: hypothetical protein VEZ49_06055, partial [Gemmatimonadales bacterium]|nr:hypothetical protein [Gemmatimonadales bacterium]
GYIALDAPRKRALAAGAVAVDWEYTPDQDAPPPYATQPAAAGAPVVSSHRGHHNTATPAPASPAPPPTVTATPAATPHPAAATTPTPAVPEPPKSPYVVCMAEGDPHTKYINPPIDGGSGNASTWMKAYRAYLQPRYDYRGPIRCVRQSTRDAAQAFYEKMLAETREPPANGRVPPKIVVTEWK